MPSIPVFCSQMLYHWATHPILVFWFQSTNIATFYIKLQIKILVSIIKIISFVANNLTHSEVEEMEN